MASPLLTEVLAASRATWPGIEIPDEDFAAYLAARIDTPLDEALGTIAATDLWLACGITRGIPAALRELEARLGAVAPAIAHLDGGSALVADVTAAVRERVLGTDGNGRIADYRGRGDLHGWLRVVAVREALQLLRARKREAPISDDLAERMDDRGVELGPAEKHAYREAFAAALATLTPRERNLVKQQYVYGATIDELGKLYGVHRATAARWLAQIRDTLLHRTRARIAEAMSLTGTDLDSAMGKLADHVDYSLRHTLSRE